jgi:MFS family permease
MSAATITPIPRAFFSVAVANFLFFLNFAFFFLLPIWVLEHGGGEETAGRVVGIAGLAGLVVLPLVGYLLDRFGRRRFMIAGALTMSAVSVAFMGLETIGPMLYVLRIVQGIAFTCAFTGAQTLCVLFAPYSRRAEALGWFGISTVLTHAISPTIGEEIVLRWGFDTMFATGAVFGLAAFIMTCTLPKPPQLVAPPSAGKLDDGTARRAVLYACVAMLCYGFGFGATQTFVPILMERFEIGRVGIFFTLWSLSAVTVRILLRKTSDRIGRRAVLVPAMATMSLAVAVLAFARSMPGICTVAIAFGLAQGLLYPTMNALVADLSNPNNIGRTQSLFSGSYSLGIASCAFFFGSVAERYGYTTMFLSVLVITCLGLAIFVAGPREIELDPT